MTLVAGVDSSTQSCKIVVCDADTGVVVRSAKAPHPPGTEVDPRHWWTALTSAIAEAGGLEDVDAISVGGQQHGMICLDSDGVVVRNALLWNDTRSAASAVALVDELGADNWASAVGVVPVASITASKLRWMADNEPELADATAAVCLPHDWLTWQLSGALGIDALVTDRSDASGTGYFAAADDSYRTDLLELAFGGRRPRLPRVLGPADRAGRTDSGTIIGAGAGDNASAALGLAAGPRDCIVSLGTSGVVSAVTEVPPRDASGLVAGFADATGRQLPLVCTLNGAPVLAATAVMLGVDLDEFGRLALSALPGAGGLVMIPYFAGERSPNLPDATGSVVGITADNWTPPNVARAAVEGLLCSLVYCMDLIRDQGIEVGRILVTGGGSRSDAVLALAPRLFGRPVAVPAPAEYVALGAARQAAWALTGDLPDWGIAAISRDDGTHDREIYERYRSVSDAVAAGPPAVAPVRS
ncbi:FGGY family carbohydrate kinase [Gordonia sp. ABSL11-1]|uniref:xylulokinase n=1 Tax=Gordonia sp. ABSL11-1 TaxID=3053924 RepID=UPI002572A892|nr:FGGY family carbohydrate kinase [Gordonia sp. ABSL11-1]MDL9946849.1 FGGY family carbohydrate kinase [Gordonia sp. ABSL11-1]